MFPPPKTNRSASLSHARSPSALGSTSITPYPLHDLEMDSFDLSPKINQHKALKDLHSGHPIENPLFPSEESVPKPKKGVSFGLAEELQEIGDGVDDDEDVSYEDEDGGMRASGFQPPDSKELTGIMISFTLVILLALAAGATTIYDWVL